MNEQYGVFIIRDNGSGDSSMPFFAHTSNVAIRQFTNTLRTLPNSCRADFELCSIGTYDHSNAELKDTDEMSIAKGDDVEIIRIMELDKQFYGRVSIDSLPVVNGGNS